MIANDLWRKRYSGTSANYSPYSAPISFNRKRNNIEVSQLACCFSFGLIKIIIIRQVYWNKIESDFFSANLTRSSKSLWENQLFLIILSYKTDIFCREKTFIVLVTGDKVCVIESVNNLVTLFLKVDNNLWFTYHVKTFSPN